jgi:hypothetical protein
VDSAGQAGGYSSRTTSISESLSDFSRPWNKTTPKTQPALKENPTQNLTKQLQTDQELTSVNTKNWYRKGTDLWAEFGDEIPFGRENLLRGFGKECLRLAMHHHSAKGLFALLKGSFRECVMTWPDIGKERVDGVYEMNISIGALI